MRSSEMSGTLGIEITLTDLRDQSSNFIFHTSKTSKFTCAQPSRSLYFLPLFTARKERYQGQQLHLLVKDQRSIYLTCSSSFWITSTAWWSMPNLVCALSPPAPPFAPPIELCCSCKEHVAAHFTLHIPLDNARFCEKKCAAARKALNSHLVDHLAIYLVAHLAELLEGLVDVANTDSASSIL